MLCQAMQEQYGLLFWMNELFPILFQTTQGGAFAVPQKIAVDVGHLSRDADLVAVEVVGLLAAFAFFVDPVAYLCVPLTPNVRIGGFVWATACFSRF